MSNQVIERKPNGQFAKGVSGNLGGNAQRSRHALNADTIREMRLAFRRGGRKAIDKVMKNKPDIFLKLLVLLVPREMKVEHTGGVKAMTDEQLEQGIEAITAMLAARESRRRGAGDRRCARAGGVAGAGPEGQAQGAKVRSGCGSRGHSRRKRKFLTEINGWTRRAPRRARPTPPVL